MLAVHHALFQEDLDAVQPYIPVINREQSVLITGSTGMIGSFIVYAFIRYNALHRHKYRVYCAGRDHKRLSALYGSYEPMQVVLVNSPINDKAMRQYSPDYIIHAASNSDPRSFSLYPVETMEANVIATYALLEGMKGNPGCRFVFLSSREVYGFVSGSASYTEDEYGLVDFNALRSTYPEGKRSAELLCKAFASEFGLQTMIARLGYIYGPTMKADDSKVIAQFIRSVLRQENIVMKSKGEQRRAYTYVADAASGILSVLFKGKPGEAYNVSNEEAVVSIRDIAEMAADIAGTEVIFDVPSDMEKTGYSPPQDAVLSSKKLRELGWEYSYTFDSGFHRAIDILMNKQ